MVVKKPNVIPAVRHEHELKVLAQYIQQANEQPEYVPPLNELLDNCKHIVDCLDKKTVVKKPNVISTVRHEHELKVLAQYIQQANEQPEYVPPLNELLENCKHIVDCLARSTGDEHELSELLSSVEVFLLRNVTTLHAPLCHEMVSTILDRLFFVTSNLHYTPSAITSVVLVVCFGLDSDIILNVARELIEKEDRGTPNRLRTSLSCFYTWMCQWNSRTALGDWLIAFINALEEKEHFDILIEVSLEKIDNLFLALAAPNAIYQPVTDVILHVMASLREFKLAFDKIAPAVNHMLTVLASNSDQWSRQLLQNVVDVTKSMIENLKRECKETELVLLRIKYSDVMITLENYMGTRSRTFLKLPPWHWRPSGSLPKIPARKVGLINLGNTCYINSIMQALLATKQFSIQAVMNMSNHPYWSKLASVFTDMMHSTSTKINPSALYTIVKTFSISLHQQQDCTEFFEHLLSLLSSYEHEIEENYNYDRPVVIFPSRKTCTTVVVYESPSSDVIVNCPRLQKRPALPGPGTSTSQSVVRGNKRSAPDDIDDSDESQNKRMCLVITLDTFVEKMFGGVFRTHIQCSNCQAMSVSREKFCDLQLSLPEKDLNCRLHVDKLIDFYFTSEILNGANKYYCSQCEDLSAAVRVLFCDITPMYLVIMLKTFRYDQRGNTQKLVTSVCPSRNVSLQTQDPGTENKYSLYCCVIHEGTTATAGHYYTVAKDNDQWYIFNDEKVSMVGDDYLQNLGHSSTPYMLFYRRTDVREAPYPTFDEIPVKYREQIVSYNKAINTFEEISSQKPLKKYHRNRTTVARSVKDTEVITLD